MNKSRLISMLTWALIFSFILIFCTYGYLGGRFTAKQIDTAYLDDVNPARREHMIEAGSTITVQVIDLSEWQWGGVRCSLLDRSDVDIHVYLSEKDATKIDVGDIITVGGRVNYVAGNGVHKHGLFIGSAVVFPPFSFPARLKTIQHKECLDC